MFDISRNITTLKSAMAEAVVRVSTATLDQVRAGTLPKGDPFSVARVAAIQAAKQASLLIPFSPTIPLDQVVVEFEHKEEQIVVRVTVKTVYHAGVEMEALTAASVGALTLYDMFKMSDDTLEIKHVRILQQRGGEDSFKDRFEVPLRAAVVVMSDSIASGKKSDQSGRSIEERLRAEGVEVVDYRVIPDEPDQIIELLTDYADNQKMDLVITTGGTGLSPRDSTPEAMARVFEQEVPGISEAARAYGQQRTPYSMLSRGRAGLRGKTLIVNLPGSRKGVAESLDALLPGILHAFGMIRGGGH